MSQSPDQLRYNILILDDEEYYAKKIYELITKYHKECTCFPSKNEAFDRKTMVSFINRCNQYVGDRNQAESLRKYVREDLTNGKVIHIAIVDVKIDNIDNRDDDKNGAIIKKEILASLYPDLITIFCTTENYRVKFDDCKSDGDYVIEKQLLGIRNFNLTFIKQFDKILEIVQRNAGNIKVNPGPENATMPPADNDLKLSKLPKLKILWIKKEYAKIIIHIGNLIIASFVLLSIFAFILGFIFSILKFCSLFFKYRNLDLFLSEDYSSEFLKVIEMFFIIPLPVIIITGLFIFYNKVILNYLSPEDSSGGGRIEIDSKYYIGLSKSLFVSTLVSVLTINLLESSVHILSAIRKNTSHMSMDWQSFTILGLTILVLFVSYFVIENSIHHVIKITQEKKK